MRRLLIRVSLLSLLIPPLSAQTGPPPLRSQDVVLPVGGTYGQAALGDLNGDVVPDLAYIVDGQLKVVLDPAVFGVQMDPGVPANDVAIWNDVGQYHDAAVVVGPGVGGIGGATLHWWNSLLGQWSHQALSSHPDWLSATQVATCDLGGGATEVAGIMGGGYFARTIRGGQDKHLLQSTVPLVDIAYFDSDGDGLEELACVGTDRVYVFEWDVQAGAWVPQQLHMSTGFVAKGAATGRHTAGGAEWLGWLGRWQATGEDFLSHITASGAQTGDLVPGDPDVVAIAAGDWTRDGNGASDLILSWTGTQQLGLVPNLGGSDPFDPTATGGFYTLDVSDTPTSPNTGNQTQPVLGDGDGDGDLDLFFLVQALSKLWIGFNGSEDEEVLKPRISIVGNLSAGVTDSGTGLLLEFNIDHSNPLPSGDPGGDANRLEVILWEKPKGPSQDPLVDWVPDEPTTPHAIDYWSTDQLTGTPLVSLSLEANAFTTPGPAGVDDPFLPSLYFFVMRYVHATSTGRVTAVYPAGVYGMQLKGQPGGTDGDANACAAAIDSYANPNTVAELVVELDASNNPTGGVLGTVKPLPMVPAFPAGTEPSWPAQ